MQSEKKQIAVIMPALNEEKNIAQAIGNCLKVLADYHIDGEIIIVNDGSKDKTDEIIKHEAAKHPDKIRVIRHDAPKGIGASFWEGLDNSDADAVVMLPGDNENDPWEIFRYYSLLKDVDIVIPFLFNREVRSFFRNTLSFLYRFIINTTFLVNFNYTNGTVLYRKSALKELEQRSNGFFFQTDILVRTVKRGYLFAEVPYRLGLRKDGISKAVTFPSLVQVAKGYLTLVRDYYFGDKRKVIGQFSKDSLTAIRRNAENR